MYLICSLLCIGIPLLRLTVTGIIVDVVLYYTLTKTPKLLSKARLDKNVSEWTVIYLTKFLNMFYGCMYQPHKTNTHIMILAVVTATIE